MWCCGCERHTPLNTSQDAHPEHQHHTTLLHILALEHKYNLTPPQQQTYRNTHTHTKRQHNNTTPTTNTHYTIRHTTHAKTPTTPLAMLPQFVFALTMTIKRTYPLLVDLRFPCIMNSPQDTCHHLIKTSHITLFSTHIVHPQEQGLKKENCCDAGFGLSEEVRMKRSCLTIAPNLPPSLSHFTRSDLG